MPAVVRLRCARRAPAAVLSNRFIRNKPSWHFNASEKCQDVSFAALPPKRGQFSKKTEGRKRSAVFLFSISREKKEKFRCGNFNLSRSDTTFFFVVQSSLLRLNGCLRSGLRGVIRIPDRKFSLDRYHLLCFYGLGVI